MKGMKRVARSLLESGLDVVWLRSLKDGLARGKRNCHTQKLRGCGVIDRKAHLHHNVTLWGPGKNYDAFLEALDGS